MIKYLLKKLPRSFYSRPTLVVAKKLLGKILVRKIGKTLLAGRIVEVEAYLGSKDPASHAYRGKTKRNEVMFGPEGHLYVYFTYGMHYCANVVTGKEGVAEALLIRAIEPLTGVRVMERNRRFSKDRLDERNLTNGPAKLCQALRIARGQNGTDLLGDEIYLTDSEKVTKAAIGNSARIGISSGKEYKWRFFIEGNKWVSR